MLLRIVGFLAEEFGEEPRLLAAGASRFDPLTFDEIFRRPSWPSGGCPAPGAGPGSWRPGGGEAQKLPPAGPPAHNLLMMASDRSVHRSNGTSLRKSAEY